MLADPKSQALVENFAGQWLLLRNLQSAALNEDDFPNFDDNAAPGLSERDEMFFESIMRENRNVLDLLNGGLHLRERAPRGALWDSEHLREPVPARGGDGRESRAGLLGQGSLLTVTSYPNRTSPVLRGKWILGKYSGDASAGASAECAATRRRMRTGQGIVCARAGWRSIARIRLCASCHTIHGPAGGSRWIISMQSASGEIEGSKQARSTRPASSPTAPRWMGPSALRQALMKHPEQFAGTMTEKLFDLRVRPRRSSITICRSCGGSSGMRLRVIKSFLR